MLVGVARHTFDMGPKPRNRQTHPSNDTRLVTDMDIDAGAGAGAQIVENHERQLGGINDLVELTPSPDPTPSRLTEHRVGHNRRSRAAVAPVSGESGKERGEDAQLTARTDRSDGSRAEAYDAVKPAVENLLLDDDMDAGTDHVAARRSKGPGKGREKPRQRSLQAHPSRKVKKVTVSSYEQRAGEEVAGPGDGGLAGTWTEEMESR